MHHPAIEYQDTQSSISLADTQTTASIATNTRAEDDIFCCNCKKFFHHRRSRNPCIRAIVLGIIGSLALIVGSVLITMDEAKQVVRVGGTLTIISSLCFLLWALIAFAVAQRVVMGPAILRIQVEEEDRDPTVDLPPSYSTVGMGEPDDQSETDEQPETNGQLETNGPLDLQPATIYLSSSDTNLNVQRPEQRSLSVDGFSSREVRFGGRTDNRQTASCRLPPTYLDVTEHAKEKGIVLLASSWTSIASDEPPAYEEEQTTFRPRSNTAPASSVTRKPVRKKRRRQQTTEGTSHEMHLDRGDTVTVTSDAPQHGNTLTDGLLIVRPDLNVVSRPDPVSHVDPVIQSDVCSGPISRTDPVSGEESGDVITDLPGHVALHDTGGRLPTIPSEMVLELGSDVAMTIPSEMVLELGSDVAMTTDELVEVHQPSVPGFDLDSTD